MPTSESLPDPLPVDEVATKVVDLAASRGRWRDGPFFCLQADITAAMQLDWQHPTLSAEVRAANIERLSGEMPESVQSEIVTALREWLDKGMSPQLETDMTELASWADASEKMSALSVEMNRRFLDRADYERVEQITANARAQVALGRFGTTAGQRFDVYVDDKTGAIRLVPTVPSET